MKFYNPIHRLLGRALLFIHLLLSPLVFVCATVEAFEYNKVTLLTVTSILLIAGAGALNAVAWIQHRQRISQSVRNYTALLIRDPLVIGFILFLASAIVSSLPGISISPLTSLYGANESFAGLLTITSYVILFFATRSLCKKEEDVLFLLSATVIAVLISLSYGLVQLVGLDPIPWGRTSTTGGITRIFGTMGNPNFFAAFLLMGFPMVAYYSSRTYNRGHRLLSACLMITAILDVIMIFASNSRGSWIGFIATVSVYLGGVYFLAKDRKFVSRIFISLVTGLLGFVVISMSSENGQRFAHALKDRGLSLINIRSLNHEARRYIWESAIRMFEDHPIFGVGLDGFQLAFEHYRTVEYWNAEWNGTPAKAHNEILHILATQGIFGGFATLVIVLGIMIAFKRALQLNLINHKLTIALFSGIVGFLVQDLFSFTVAGCGTLFVTYAALLSSFGRWELKINSIPINVPPISRNGAFLPRLLYAVFSGGIILALIKFMYFPYKANLYCSLGLSMINTDSARSVSWFQKAVQLDPHKELYWVQLGKANRLSARKESDPIQRNIYFHEAYNAYIQSIHLVPENSYNWANLGRLLSDMIQESLSKDLRQEIYLAFSKALALDPNNAYFYLSGSKAVLSMGDSGTAFDWAEKCVKRYPSFEPCMSQYKYIKSIASHPTLESAFQK